MIPGSLAAPELGMSGLQKGIISFGTGPSNTSIGTTLISSSGAFAADVTQVGPLRILPACASYGLDKAIYAFGFDSTSTFFTSSSLVSNTGVVAAETATAAGQGRYGSTGAGYGLDKALLFAGDNGGASGDTRVYLSNTVSNTGVVGSDTATTDSNDFATSPTYGLDKAIIFGGSDSLGTLLNLQMLVSNTGVIGSSTATTGTAGYGGASASYGSDKAIIGYGQTNITVINLTRLVSNVGIVSSDVTGIGTARVYLSAAVFGGDKAVFAFGSTSGTPAAAVATTNQVSNTGVVAADVTSANTARFEAVGCGFSLT